MNKILYILFFILVIVAPAKAEVTVVPPELNKVIQKIEDRQNRNGVRPRSSAKIIFKGDQIILLQPSGEKSFVYFDGQTPSIDKHFQLKDAHDSYAFEVVLQYDGQAYQHTIRSINGVDALLFFNDTDMFIYTQESGDGGNLELKEWIYALKPNTAGGSQWQWIFKSEKFQWPLTIEMGDNGVATVNRHLPFAGIPIDAKARSQFMLDTMVKFKKGDPIKKYFPFSEKVVSMPAARYSTREGVDRPADISVLNSSVIDESRPKPKVGLDFNRWEEHWRTIYKITVSAQTNEYPLLLE
jgi:hypothetical protein